MIISLRKTIPQGRLDGTPSSFFYNYGGDKTITLNGASKFIMHTKKDLQKIPNKKGVATWESENTDVINTRILDLKTGTDDFVINGWLEDDATDTAWEKYFRLRAMAAMGGPLTNFTMEDIVWTDATQQVYLEDISGTIIADDTGSINVLKKDGTARIEVTMTIFVANAI